MIFNSETMDLNFNNAVGFLTFKSLNKFDFIKHCFTTRLGGVSKGVYRAMNLNHNRGDSDEDILTNYNLLCDAVGFNYNSLVAGAQDHGINIRHVGINEVGIGIRFPKDMNSIDGLITNEKGVTLVNFFADCVPLYFIDPVKKVIGIAHAGWRGTVNKIAGVMVNEFIKKYNSSASDLLVCIGPSIGKCCFEVGIDVAKEFMNLKNLNLNKIITDIGNSKYKIDLWETNKQILIKHGVIDKNITVTDLCTYCNDGLFFSHRKTNGKRGGMTAMMCME